MELFECIEQGKEGFDYGVRFVNNRQTFRYFDQFMDIVGNAKPMKYDYDTDYWWITEHDYKKLVALNSKAFPSKAEKREKHKAKMKAAIINTEAAGELEVADYDKMGADMKLQPYDYQKKVIKFALDAENALVVSPCGSGKTPMGIGIYLEALKAGKIKGPGMIVVKASLKTQWGAEIKKFSNLNPKVIQTYKEATKKYAPRIKKQEKKLEKAKNLKEQTAIAKAISALKQEAEEVFLDQFKGADLLVMNYETLRDAKVRTMVHKLHVDFCFADEAHYVKSDTTERSRALCEFNDIKMKIGATATPLQRDPRDLFGIYKFVNPKLFPKKGAFERMYIRWAGRGRVAGSKNEKQLNEKISPYMVILTKDEVAKQLPSLVVSQRYCEFEPAQQEVHNRLMEELDELHEQEKRLNDRLTDAEAKNNPELKKIEAGIMMRQTFAQELADSEQLLLASDSKAAEEYVTGKSDNKLKLLMDTLEEILDSGEKVCIFSKYTVMQQIITEAVEKAAKKNAVFKGVGIAYVNGSLSGEKRYHEVYDKFRDDPDCKILVMSDAGAEGINLGHCKYLIEYDLADSYAIQTQRHGRLERADSVHDTVYVIQLVCENSWDEIALKIVSKKERYDATIVKGEEVEFEGYGQA